MMKNTFSANRFSRTAVVAGVALAAVCGTAIGAQAQPTNQPAGGQATPPPYAQPMTMPSYAAKEEHIHGRVTAIDGKYRLKVRDDRGFVDTVSLHDGTIINPTGLRLSPGQTVTVLGHNAGNTFEANEIDTPYANYGGYAYGYPGYYPYYNYPFALGLGFGGPGYRFRGWF